jgi:hypothetical protein
MSGSEPKRKAGDDDAREGERAMAVLRRAEEAMPSRPPLNASLFFVNRECEK